MCILTPSGLKKWPQMPIMTISEIETTSKVSLKLTSRINLGRRGVPGPSSRLCTQTTSPPPPPRPTQRKGLSQANKDPYVPQEPLIPPPQDCKSGPKWQSQTMPKIETTSKMPLKLTSRINPGRRAPDPGHSPQHPPPHRIHTQSPERANQPTTTRNPPQSQLTPTEKVARQDRKVIGPSSRKTQLPLYFLQYHIKPPSNSAKPLQLASNYFSKNIWFRLSLNL